jgi:hypothetical protein
VARLVPFTEASAHIRVGRHAFDKKDFLCRGPHCSVLMEIVQRTGHLDLDVAVEGWATLVHY